MHFVYDLEDEEAYEEARDRLIEDFERWEQTRRTAPLAAFVAQCACDYRFATGDGLLTRWSEPLVEDFLMQYTVRQVSLPREDWPEVVPGLQAWFGYLASTGQLDPRGEPADRLATVADALGERFLAVMADQEHWGPAKFWTMTALERGIDPQDERAMRRFLNAARNGTAGVDEALVARIAQRHQEKMLMEQFGFVDEPRRRYTAETGPRMLPQLPVFLATHRDLLAAVARVPLTGRLRDFVAWVGQARTLTQRGALRAADVHSAAEALGLGPQADTRRNSEVELLFAWAKTARLVKVRKGELSQVKQAAGILRDEVKLWTRAFTALPGLAEHLLPEDTLLDPLDLVLPDVLAALYSMEEPSELVLLRASVRHAAQPEPLFGIAPTPLSAAERAQVDRHFDRLLGFLREFGAVELYRGKQADPAVPPEAATAVMLTPAGTHGTYTMLKDLGRHLPVVGELTGADASSMLSVVYDEYTPATTAAELARWRAARPSPQDADEQLRAALRRIPFEDRRFGILHLLADSLEDGEAFVRSLRTDPDLGALALGLLLETGAEQPDDQKPEDLAAAMVESLAALLRMDGPQGLMQQMEDIPRDAQQDFLDALAATSHPQAYALLDAVALHHPDRRIAKHARKARLKTQH